LDTIGPIHKIFIGLVLYCPLSSVKKMIFQLLGAKIGDNVYLGPGSVIISTDYSQVILGKDVFIAPGVMITVNSLTIGDQSHIGYQSLLVGESLSIGKRCNINNRAFIESSYAPIDIEDDVTIAASVIISTHDGSYRHTRGLDMKAAPIILKDHAFIGNNAIILPGITVGKRAIVGVGAVVTKNVLEDSTVVGVPAKDIKNRV
jgi:UDP-2-acetamido-3-amino-2,3-dideoxy-glucuronate N-acetyltransferase